ncbi:hypothetical protein F443_11535 [Plasmopara halstedii]|uniref:Cyclic nucleotide-binding domain-containing protein n=1 Tax=Plasmopara halstedii TaxID=4781 RepID=A0A0P1AI01_PLAHL|nr:hypothetical protein F443_11535 [Plasmopara halstedii]CEG40801.1 hypothetical protein F443_11535 [Plasmopara halstedii]|eukprot:XP_024577170.1 hypothetical protein F443_11535 [Plasmopara halstedii]
MTHISVRRARKLSRELREKTTFLKGVACFDQWGNEAILSLCDRMVRIDRKYNDVIIAEGEPASAFFFVKHGDCRLVKRYSALERKKKQHDRRDRCYVEISTISRMNLFDYKGLGVSIEVSIADKKKVLVKGAGAVEVIELDGKGIHMVEILHIPGLDRRLLSVGKLAERGMSVEFSRSD